MTIGKLLAAIMALLICNAGLSFAIAEYVANNRAALREDVRDYVAPVVVVNMKRIAEEKMKTLGEQMKSQGALSKEEIEATGAKMGAEMVKVLQELRGRGYVVLEQSSVLTAPEKVVITEAVAKQLGVALPSVPGPAQAAKSAP